MLTLLFCACYNAPQKHGSSPDWVKAYNNGETISSFSGSIVGIGYSEPAFYLSDALDQATKKARAEAARAFSGDIKNIIFENLGLMNSTQEILITYKTNVVLENSRIVDIWIDAAGHTGRKNGVYALCVIPKALTSTNLGAGNESEKLIRKGVPEWLAKPEVDQAVITSIGVAQKAYYSEDQHSYAYQNAVEEIKKIIELRVSEIIVLYEGLNKGWLRTASELEITSELTEVIISNSVELDYWVDEEGLLGCVSCSYLLMELNPQMDESVSLSIENEFKIDESKKEMMDGIIHTAFDIMNDPQMEREDN